jgi:hypothetical protein
MSFAELKEQVAVLSAEERLQLAAFLAELDEKNEAEFQEIVANRMKAMDAGKKVTAEEFEARHNELRSKGL